MTTLRDNMVHLKEYLESGQANHSSDQAQEPHLDDDEQLLELISNSIALMDEMLKIEGFNYTD